MNAKNILNEAPCPITIAYADDHQAVRKGIITYLKQLGGIEIIIEASNGKDLIDQIAAHKLKPDICLLDIQMPVMNGFETLENIRHKWPEMKTIALSTFTEELYVLKMIKAGVNGYLSKECNPYEIKEAIVCVQENGVYYSEFFAKKIALSLQHKEDFLPHLTEKEIQFLKFSCTELTYVQIATTMKHTVKSIEGYRDSLFKKLKVRSRVQLAIFAIKTGLVDIYAN